MYPLSLGNNFAADDLATYNSDVTQSIIYESFFERVEKFYWGEVPGSEAMEVIRECYDRVVYWRRNFFMLLNGSSGKDYIKETTRLMNSWCENTDLKEIVMTAIHIIPALLL